MAFMIPEYLIRRAWVVDVSGYGLQPFFAATPFDQAGGDEVELAEWFADLLGLDASDILDVSRDDYPKAYVRLSAPGYMDATEWSGFDTLEEAREHVREFWEVDPDTGESLCEEDAA